MHLVQSFDVVRHPFAAYDQAGISPHCETLRSEVTSTLNTKRWCFEKYTRIMDAPGTGSTSCAKQRTYMEYAESKSSPKLPGQRCACLAWRVPPTNTSDSLAVSSGQRAESRRSGRLSIALTCVQEVFIQPYSPYLSGPWRAYPDMLALAENLLTLNPGATSAVKTFECRSALLISWLDAVTRWAGRSSLRSTG